MKGVPDPHYRHRFPAETGRARCGGFRRDDPTLVPKVGPTFANRLRRRRPKPGDRWHLDEVFAQICCYIVKLPKRFSAEEVAARVAKRFGADHNWGMVRIYHMAVARLS